MFHGENIIGGKVVKFGMKTQSDKVKTPKGIPLT